MDHRFERSEVEHLLLDLIFFFHFNCSGNTNMATFIEYMFIGALGAFENEQHFFRID